MKTIVLVSIPGAVLGLEPSDFPAGLPVEGRKYEFDGKIYRVTEIVESLGSRTFVGTKIIADLRLLKFVETVSRGDEALKLNLMKPKPVGVSGPEDVRSKGGIIIGQTEEKPMLEGSGSEQLHIILVTAVSESKSGVQVPHVRLQSLLGSDPSNLLGDDAEASEPRDN